MSDPGCAHDAELILLLEEQEERLANAHRIAREAIDLCELFVNRLTHMASVQFGAGKAAFGRSGELEGGEEGADVSDEDLILQGDCEGGRFTFFFVSHFGEKIQPVVAEELTE
jgi:hypothetical protein